MLRNSPDRVAASSTRPFGDSDSRFTCQNDELVVAASCAHVVPLSVLLKMPAPRIESPL